MLKKSFLIFCVLSAAILIGCSRTETNSNSSTTPANANKATTTTSTPASTGDKIGVPECDDFLAKYETCVTGKVPEMARAQYQSAMKQWRDAWKKQAESPQTRSALAAACKQAAEQQAAALKTFGCTW